MKAPLAILRTHFTARYEGRLAELVRLLEAQDLDRLELALHSLAGIAGTYGFSEITEIAREGERQCNCFDAHALRLTVARLIRFRLDGRWAA